MPSPLYTIYYDRTEYFYIDTNSLLSNWEQLIGCYENRVYTAEKGTYKVMKITDLNGCPIEVTNSNEAIKMTGQYKDYRHGDKGFFEFYKRQKPYCTDIYEKLRAVKNN